MVLKPNEFVAVFEPAFCMKIDSKIPRGATIKRSLHHDHDTGITTGAIVVEFSVLGTVIEPKNWEDKVPWHALDANARKLLEDLKKKIETWLTESEKLK